MRRNLDILRRRLRYLSGEAPPGGEQSGDAAQGVAVPEADNTLSNLSTKDTASPGVEQKKRSRKRRQKDRSWKRVGEFTLFRRHVERNPLEGRHLNLRLSDRRVHPRDLLFYDTETTGLSGGAGNVVFLIGLAWIEGKDLHFEQVLLTDYPGEADFLAYLAQKLTPNRVYVSFNGKSFDSHILKTRYLMNRLDLEMPKQLDLLHISRRFWKRITGNCSLTTLEREILGVSRHGDISGAEIPDLYFDFLNTGDLDSLSVVVEHNLQDVHSLVLLLSRIEGLFSDGDIDIPVDRSGLGTFLLSEGDMKGLIHLRDAFETGDPRAGKILADHYKRQRRWEEALTIWKRMAAKRNLYAIIELAKYYEHTASDPQRALSWVTEIQPWQIGDALFQQDLRKRRARLELKIERITTKHCPG